MITVEEVTGTHSFSQLEEAWNKLVDSSHSGFITQTWEWQFSWWQVFESGRELLILLAWEHGELIGIAPLLRREVKGYGVRWKRLEFLASGEPEADEICSDYLDFILAPGRESDVIQAFWRYLHSSSADWDELHLVCLPQKSATARLVGSQQGFRLQERTNSVVVALPSSWEQFLGTLSKKMRFRVRRHRRLLAEKGPVQLQRISTPGELAARFPEFMSLHQRWWQSRGKPGCFRSELFTRFHQLVSQRLAQRGLVDLYFLSVAGQTVAARYCFHFGSRILDYQTGVDPEFDPRIGVGVECTGFCLEDAIARGFQEYDFGEGQHPYKLRWTSQLRGNLNLQHQRPHIKMRWVNCASGLHRMLARLKRRAFHGKSSQGEEQ